MADLTTTVLADDLVFPEGPRWREDRLFVSDQHERRVLTVDPAGSVETVVHVPGGPSGLGWRPDGQMLVVSMQDRRLLRLDPSGELVEVADLSALAPFHCNDMVVDASGRAYVGNFGFDLDGRAKPASTVLILVDVDGTARVVAEDMRFPNGTVITEDGATLVVGESMGGCLTAFDVDRTDGSLSNRRLWAQLEGAVPDGICLDAQGAIWSACPMTGRVLRVREGGEVTDVVHVSRRGAYACMLGGDDGRTLFVCTADSSNPAHTGERRGAIEAVGVAVPHAGLP
jgi:sugar lactone lactonase YvrE